MKKKIRKSIDIKVLLGYYYNTMKYKVKNYDIG